MERKRRNKSYRKNCISVCVFYKFFFTSSVFWSGRGRRIRNGGGFP